MTREESKEMEWAWVILIVQKETALRVPAHRIVSFDVQLADDSHRTAFEVWELKKGIETIIPPKPDEDEDENEEGEEIEVKHRMMLSKEVLLGALETNANLEIQIKGKLEGKDK